MSKKKVKVVERGVITRKIARNIIRKHIGSNRIQKAWHDFQIKRRGAELADVLAAIGKGKKPKRNRTNTKRDTRLKKITSNMSMVKAAATHKRKTA